MALDIGFNIARPGHKRVGSDGYYLAKWVMDKGYDSLTIFFPKDLANEIKALWEQPTDLVAEVENSGQRHEEVWSRVWKFTWENYDRIAKVYYDSKDSHQEQINRVRAIYKEFDDVNKEIARLEGLKERQKKLSEIIKDMED